MFGKRKTLFKKEMYLFYRRFEFNIFYIFRCVEVFLSIICLELGFL